MTVHRLALLALLSLSVRATVAEPAQSRDYGCTEWRACRELALAAASSGDYETFHDLAWRAVQTGPRNDPGLMQLLARAQSLSGRPLDALVMLDRLAAMGVATDAATNDDFSRTRQLPGWPEVAARIERLAEPPASPPPEAPASRDVPAATAEAAVAPVLPAPAVPTPVLRLQGVEAVRFAVTGFSVSGLAYDAVSERFVFGDRLGRRLVVVGERTNRAMDLVRSESAGFNDIAAMELDAKRGDLWVASMADGAARLHRLQLTSGRPLRMFDIAADGAQTSPVDLSIGPGGAVLVLDAATPRLLMLNPGATSLEPVAALDADEVTSVAAGGDTRTAYVAHRDGIIRLDLRTRRATRLRMPAAARLGRVERLRWRGGALFAITIDPAGTRQVQRLALDPGGGAITGAEVLGSLEPGQPMFATIAGDELLYVLEGSEGRGDGAAAAPTPGRLPEIVTYRVRLP